VKKRQRGMENEREQDRENVREKERAKRERKKEKQKMDRIRKEKGKRCTRQLKNWKMR